MSTILYIIAAILILGVLIIVHELGHFLVGKKLGFKILEFGIGFGPTLVKWERKEIKYSIRLIPLGGFVSFFGEDEDNPNDPRAMNNMPWYKRFLTLLAGPGFNILFAMVIAFVLFASSGYSTPVIQSINQNAPLAQTQAAGGDAIIAINGVKVTTSEQFNALMNEAHGKPVVLKLRRGEETFDVTTAFYKDYDRTLGITVREQNGSRPIVNSVAEQAPLASADIQAGDVIARINDKDVATVAELNEAVAGLAEDSFRMTLVRDGKTFEIESSVMKTEVQRIGVTLLYQSRPMPVGEALVESLKADWDVSVQIFSFLGQLFTGRADLSMVTGPVGTIGQMSDMVSAGAQAGGNALFVIILNLMWAISLNLAIFNLLPIPALDGARMVFALLEGIRKKPVKRELEAKIHAIGFMLLIAFVVFVEIRNAFF